MFLNIHEYIHTQQKTTICDNLLAQTVLEGVTEFLTEKTSNTESPNPQIKFGNENDARIKAKFEPEMFSPEIYNWIWNSAKNEFGMRDLAYYVGYKVSQGYYNTSSDKQLAIEQMINFEYNNEEELIKFGDKPGYFSKPLAEYKKTFEDSKSVSFQIEKLEPLKKYQLIVDSGFSNMNGVPLVPYLIHILTEEN